MEIRHYRLADKEPCLAIFDSNSPEFFSPQERICFDKFLDRLPGPFFVGHEEGQIVACGGYARHYTKPNTWTLHWGMVAADRQRKGYGSQMLFTRMDQLFSKHGFVNVELVTSYLCNPFFLWRGFHVIAQELCPLRPETNHLLTMQPFEHRWKTGALDPVSSVNAFKNHHNSRDWKVSEYMDQ